MLADQLNLDEDFIGTITQYDVSNPGQFRNDVIAFPTEELLGTVKHAVMSVTFDSGESCSVVDRVEATVCGLACGGHDLSITYFQEVCK